MLALKTTLSELQAEQSSTSERQNDYGDKGQAYSVRFLYNFAALGGPFPLTNIFLALFTRLSGIGPDLFGFPKLGRALLLYLAGRKIVLVLVSGADSTKGSSTTRIPVYRPLSSIRCALKSARSRSSKTELIVHMPL